MCEVALTEQWQGRHVPRCLRQAWDQPPPTAEGLRWGWWRQTHLTLNLFLCWRWALYLGETRVSVLTDMLYHFLDGRSDSIHHDFILSMKKKKKETLSRPEMKCLHTLSIHKSSVFEMA